MAGEVLRMALGHLDELTKRGGGALPVLPQKKATQISAAVYSIAGQDFVYIAWPQVDYNLITSAWQQLAPLIGAKSPFGANEDIGRAVADNNWTVAVPLFRTAQTVDQARAAIRGLLVSLGIPTTPIRTPVNKKKFPWGWVVGTLALGMGLMLSLNFTSKHGEAP